VKLAGVSRINRTQHLLNASQKCNDLSQLVVPHSIMSYKSNNCLFYRCNSNLKLLVRKMYQPDANNFTMIFSHKWPLHVSDIYMSIFRSSFLPLTLPSPHPKNYASWILTDKQCTRLHTNSAGPQPQHLCKYQ